MAIFPQLEFSGLNPILKVAKDLSTALVAVKKENGFDDPNSLNSPKIILSTSLLFW